VVRSSSGTALAFGDEVNQAIEEKLSHSATTVSQSTPSPVVLSPALSSPDGDGEGKSENKRRKKQEIEKESPLLPSEFQFEGSPGDSTPIEEAEA